jgi:hypothetical protein
LPPIGLTQEYWDTGNRMVIPWDAIHRLAAEQNGTPETSIMEYDAKDTKVVNATSVKEDDHNSKAKLAKLVKLAKSRALWCLSPYVPLS